MKATKAELSWLENPEVFEVNRLDAHSDHKYWVSNANGEWIDLRQSLNGIWNFSWSKCPSERPAEFFQEGFKSSGFGTIEVPGHIELQDYGQIQYINTMYPWEGSHELRPPKISWEDNPVGSYIRYFDLEDALQGKRACISFQGVETAFYVWLNGFFVGYAEDSFTPSDFDITPYVREKDNRLCVEVYKRSSASWIEDQDFFRFSGIFREVFLYAKPDYHVEDIWVKSGLTQDNRAGTLQVSVRISKKEKDASTTFLNTLNIEELFLYFSLLNSNGIEVWRSVPEKFIEETDRDGQWFSTEETVLPDIHPWSSQNPYLYTMQVKLCTKNGNTVEKVCCRTGFRRFEIKNKVMMLNGKRIVIHGVNRHEWNPYRGRAITREDMERDIQILKRNHINAVRTSHYPNQSLWYSLCDENGIYIMDEANLESHGSWQKMGKCEPSWNVPGSLSQWEACAVDRAVSMVQRDKNHPSVLWWSCGNESYAGTCILSMSKYFHEKDPSRVVHYEGVYWNRAFHEISDVESRMYASPQEVRKYLENDPQKPYLLCEYMHSMGNSLGGMESYMRLIDEFPMFQGGFIWDYIDQAIYRTDLYGNKQLCYGGDFADRPTDYSFSADGILFADRTEKPAMQEVRYWYASSIERAAFDQRNQRAEAKMDVYPFTLEKADESWEIIHGDVNLGVKGDDFHFIFSYQEHGPVSIVYGGREWLYRIPRPAFWRATTENDNGNGFPLKSAVWCGMDQYMSCTGCKVKENERSVSIVYTYVSLSVLQVEVTISYTVTPDGKILVETSYQGNKELPSLPLFGVRFALPEQAERVRWLGLSGETYPDRYKGGIFGIHESKPDIPAYLVPQECANHMNTRWMQLWNGNEGIQISMNNKPFHFSAIPYTPQQLESATHREELPMPRRTVVTVLSDMRGVGGIDSWGSDVEEACTLSGEKNRTLSFVISKPKNG